MKAKKCSVCVNSHNEIVVTVAEHYNMCESCNQENFENKAGKIYKLEKLLEFIIEGGID